MLQWLHNLRSAAVGIPMGFLVKDILEQNIFPGARLEATLISNVRIDAIVQDGDVEPVIDAACEAAQTGKYVDGKIFVYNVIDAARVRTREHGACAI